MASPRAGWKRCGKHRWLYISCRCFNWTSAWVKHGVPHTEIGHVRSSTLQGYCWAIMEPQVIPTDPKWVCLKIDSPKLDDWAPHFAKIATILGFTLFSDTPWYTQNHPNVFQLLKHVRFAGHSHSVGPRLEHWRWPSHEEKATWPKASKPAG